MGKNHLGVGNLASSSLYVQEYIFFEDKTGLTLKYPFTEPYGSCIIPPLIFQSSCIFFPGNFFQNTLSHACIFSIPGRKRRSWSWSWQMLWARRMQQWRRELAHLSVTSAPPPLLHDNPPPVDPRNARSITSPRVVLRGGVAPVPRGTAPPPGGATYPNRPQRLRCRRKAFLRLHWSCSGKGRFGSLHIPPPFSGGGGVIW